MSVRIAAKVLVLLWLYACVRRRRLETRLPAPGDPIRWDFFPGAADRDEEGMVGANALFDQEGLAVANALFHEVLDKGGEPPVHKRLRMRDDEMLPELPEQYRHLLADWCADRGVSWESVLKAADEGLLGGSR
jgi:hypothetical protein